MKITRREFVAAGLGAAALPSRERSPLGLVIHSFPVRIEWEKGKGIKPGLTDPFRFVDRVAELGASAAQVGLGSLSNADADRLRDKSKALGIALEGIASLPDNPSGQARFEAELVAARRAGATVVRTVMLSGRRYETFRTRAAFLEHQEKAEARLKAATAVARRVGVRLAVENHKDLLAEDLARLVKRIGGDLGVCLDTGNNMALLEDPLSVVEILAPLALTTHLKDMATEPTRDGFLLAEVPLGRGALDLAAIVGTIRKAAPGIRLNLEMITRDPLPVPCLTEDYRRTFPIPPTEAARRAVERAKAERREAPLPRPSRSPVEDRLAVEDDNIRLSLAYAERFRQV